ncbi:lipopolysaccharide biosynthesis protein [Halobacterium litoreum]|uniref:Lipopolysaccharide biosynthesis protein n=1 Tax=Halobacterium litoreum TaxID=2039234 RepID=A0ABD5NDQ6_9EURY|nr:lipopolysaccharide biosynthesis protein [Halobacterium litoreum]UHH14127.1 lipopolysaccharide biosynthesis protein [Halobacterium litoreum]
MPRSADQSPDDEAVEARLDDALERVAHGAAVSVPSILVQRALTVAFTAVLTNGTSAAAYGVFALARRLQRLFRSLSLGFRSGVSRFVPNADSEAERDAIATFAAVLLLGVASVFGVALFAAAPVVADYAELGGQFETLLGVFALGLPATVWLFTTAELLRGLEAVGPLNVAMRVAFPAAQLAVGAVGALVFDDLVVVAVGVVASMALTGTAVAVWLARERGFRPRLRGPGVREIQRRYLRFTLPLFVGGIATTVQRLGFYPLIVAFLTGVAGGVFSVGVLVGALVRLPLMGVNQFIPPVAAALHDDGHRRALSRLYHVTSRLVLVGVTALAVPAIVYRRPVMALFGPTFVEYAWLLPAFVLAQYGACAAGSVGILLTMTDNQRALLVVNTLITGILVVTAVPLTVFYGLPGLVASYLLMLTLNNGLEVAVLYHLEGLQPFTRRHAYPLFAAVPLTAVALAANVVLSNPVAPVVGTLGGLAAYALALRWLGFTHAERRLAGTLAARYRGLLPT